MKLFGHPVHPLLIHFPTALLPMDLVLSWLRHFGKIDPDGRAAFYCLAGGVATGVLAMLSGLPEAAQAARKGKQALDTMLVHACVNGLVILIYAALLYRALKNGFGDIPSATLLTGKTFLLLFLFAGNYAGGRLIYHFKIGIADENNG